MREYLLICVVALAVTFLMTPVVRALAVVVKAVTPLRERDVHTVPIPRLGGLARTFRVRLFPTDMNDGETVQPAYPVPSTYPPHWIEFSLEADDCPHLL